MSAPGDTTPLEADFAALRKLRDDDASGALKEYFGDGEDPREWREEKRINIKEGRVTTLSLYQCTKLMQTIPAPKQRLQEKIVGLEDLESKRALGEESGPASRGEDSELTQTGVRKNTDGAADTTPASYQERSADVKEALMNAQELLAKANGGNSGTCSGSCNCVVA